MTYLRNLLRAIRGKPCEECQERDSNIDAMWDGFQITDATVNKDNTVTVSGIAWTPAKRREALKRVK